jgi:hypothetical protein
MDYENAEEYSDTNSMIDFYLCFRSDEASMTTGNSVSTSGHSESYLSVLNKFIKNSLKKDGTRVIKRPKRDDFRTMIIRGHKRGIRQCLKGVLPLKTVNKINIRNHAQVDAWEACCVYNIQNKARLAHLAKTENGPLTEAKKKRESSIDNVSIEKSKTFNDHHCKQYFQSEIVRKSFELYINCIFSENNCDLLSKKFGFNCCVDGVHTNYCYEKWQCLHDQLKEDFITAH